MLKEEEDEKYLIEFMKNNFEDKTLGAYIKHGLSVQFKKNLVEALKKIIDGVVKTCENCRHKYVLSKSDPCCGCHDAETKTGFSNWEGVDNV